MNTGIYDEVIRSHDMGLLSPILADRTTEKNIIWATEAYKNLGDDYLRDKEITEDSLLRAPFRLSSRVEKDRLEQSERTKTHAEVFTPLWVVKKMNEYLDTEWFGYEGAFEGKRVVFPEQKTWQQYVDSRRLEITCGEAPFLVNRYDASTGEQVPVEKRVGLLDRKLRIVCENTSSEEDWLGWAYRAFESTYGFEFQGDNLLLARINLLLTFEDFISEKLKRRPTREEYLRLIKIITWNLWQMDGLTGTIPYCDLEASQLDMFDLNDDSKPSKAVYPACKIFDWRANKSITFEKLKENHSK